MDNQSIAHTRWNCTYHIVIITKYRRKIMYGEVKKDIGEILRKLCDMSEAKLIKGTVCSDHVHLYIAIPPKLSVSKFMSYLKGIIHFVRSNRLCLLLSFSSANRCCSLDEKAKGHLCCLTDILSSEEKTVVETFGQEATM